MDVFNRVGTSMARAELRVAQRTGQIIGFKHRTALPTPFSATILEYKIGSEENPGGRRLETADLTLLIPVQSYAWSGVSGFSGTSTIFAQTNSQKPITVGDSIEWPIGSNRHFYVLEESECIHNGYSYVVKAQHQKSLTIGQSA